MTTIKINVSDIAYWPDYLTDAMQEYYINVPPKSSSLESSVIQYYEGSKLINQKLNSNAFFRITNSGEKIKRDWLVYTESNKSVYCYICKLFSK